MKSHFDATLLSRLRHVSLATACAFVIGSPFSASAAEWFVGPVGKDTNDGHSRDAAFVTIQKGLDAMASGDTLTIAPGEYPENPKRENLGDLEKQTIIRAEIPGTALLRGDVPAPEFKKVDGFQFVYAAPFDQDPLAVLEHDTLRVLVKKPDLGNIEFEPGTCFYDDAKKLLYVSPSDLRSPTGRKYSVAVRPGHGFFLVNPKRVTIDGLAVTGYCAPGTGWHFITGRTWGIALNAPVNCIVRRSTTFLNFGGIAMDNGSGNQVDACLAFGNMTYNILVFGGPNNRDNIIENSYAYRGLSGMHFYSKLAGPVTLRNNRAWGHDLDFSNKCGNEDSRKYGLVERCIGLGCFQAHGLKNTIMGGLNEYDRMLEDPADNILFAREKDLDTNREFADPANMDYHLQADSRFRGKDGQPDRGPYPYEKNIYYLSAAGSDENDGLALGSAWKTLAGALKKLKAGDTLYLEEGEYAAGLTASLGHPGEKAVRLLGRGLGKVIISGSLAVKDSAPVEFERLIFTDPVSVKGGANIVFKSCQFGGEKEGLSLKSVQGLTVSHCLFARGALGLTGCSGATITGNFFADSNGPALRIEGKGTVAYSDYNGFQNTTLVRQSDGKSESLKEVQASGHDLWSLVRDGQVKVENGIPVVGNRIALEGWGPMASALGVHSEFIKPIPALAGPFVHSVDDTTANIEWWTSIPMAVEVTWGETPEMTNKMTTRKAFQYSGYSLTGLEKGRKYFVGIRPLDGRQLAQAPKVVTFETTKAPRAKATYYVAKDGNDSSDGLSRGKALRTVVKASEVAGAGSTVLITSGSYPETVWVRATGTEDSPITFRSAPGDKVSVTSFSMAGKSHVNLDGLYTSEQIEVLGSKDIKITRCFSFGTLVESQSSDRVSVKNCVIANGFFTAFAINNSADFSADNCVILRPAINGAVINNQSDQKVRLSRNIFTDSIPFKSKIAYFAVARAESLLEKDNCYYMRTPDKEKGILVRMMFSFYGDEDYDRVVPAYGVRPASEQPSRFTKLTQIGFEEFEQIFGKTGSIFTNPEFRGASELHLEPGQRVKDKDLNEGYLIIYSDHMLGKKGLDFPDLFATNPEVVKKGIGLIPDDFKDFHFNQKPAPAP